MIKDPLFRSIIQCLNGPLDGDTFEHCAQDLLREAYPNLVPIVGGNDAGFDGAMGTPDGPYPLCCTVDKKGPLQNFRKNVSTYLAKRPNGPKRAVVATPRPLTPQKRRNLEDAASKDYGVIITNIHDQHDFALRLYRDAKWRKELLGLTGEPPALSALPRRPRPERPPLIGREEDLNWLQNSQEAENGNRDMLLIGQPGLGKTYLHEHMTLQGQAAFAVDGDSERLANAIRAQKPHVIVVDDAHENIVLLEDLIRLRTEIGADYAIHANCWPHGKAKVMTVLDLAEKSVRELQPLTMPMIRKLIEEMGIVGPDRLLWLLLHQAEGKPGLAAALVAAVQRGEYNSLWSGEAIARRLLDAKSALGNQAARSILAVLGLGGDTGLSVEETAGFLHISPLNVREIVTDLAAGGVIEELAANQTTPVHRLSVRPPVLRGWLAKECFYASVGALDPSPLIETLRQDAGRANGLAHTLMDARTRGAAIPNELLFELAQQTSGAYDHRKWEHLAAVDRQMADYVLRHAPEKVHIAASGLLAFEPERTIAALLDMGASDESESEVEAPRRKIKEWLQGGEPGDQVSIERRQMLIHSVEVKIPSTQPEKLTEYCWALSAALNPAIDVHKTSPDEPQKIVMYFGLLPLQQIQSVAALWPAVLRLTQQAGLLPKEIRRVVDDWCYPGRHNRGNNPTSQECSEFMRQMAERMLADLLPVCNRAGRTWARELSRRTKLNVAVEVDPHFHRIFGDRELHPDYETRQKRRGMVLDAVADGYLEQLPRDAMAELREFETEAADFEEINAWDRNRVYWRIAQKAENVEVWLDAAIEVKLPATHVQTMLDAINRGGRPPLVETLRTLMGTDEYRWLTVVPILSLADPPKDMLRDALDALSGQKKNKSLVYTLSAGAPPVATMKQLLSHPEQEIRSFAVIAEWKMEPEQTIREELQEHWQEVLMTVGQEDEHNLTEILQANPNLAFRWALAKIREASEEGSRTYWLWKYDRIFLEIADLFDSDQRWQLIDEIDLGSFNEEIINRLLGPETDLMSRWFNKYRDADDRGRYLALKLIQERHVDDRWQDAAIAALDAGFTPNEVADTIGLHSRSTVGPVSNYYKDYIQVFERLAKHPDQRLHPAAQRGLEWATASYERELAQEHQNAVRGRL